MRRCNIYLIKPLPLPPGEALPATDSKNAFVNDENTKHPATSAVVIVTSAVESSASKKKQDIICDVCHDEGNTSNLVTCDECKKGYHFTCLEPPLKKTPKRRGYSWHCADCDPTGSE